MQIERAEFSNWLLQEHPLMDVRAPVEFLKGTLPGAQNVPLLDDDQRHQIGLRYAEHGEQAAIELGLQLATPALRQARLAAWQHFITQHPTGALFCFRGGLRSRITQQWLAAEGIHYPLIKGGYKAVRRFLLDQWADCVDHAPMRVLAGPTGSGKTSLLQQWPQSIDLEGFARHRGSVFGETEHPQPAQIDWEHAVVVQWLRRRSLSAAPVLVEDEARLIGRIFVPEPLQKCLREHPQIQLRCPRSERIARLRHEFVLPLIARSQQSAQGFSAIEQILRHNLRRIHKRLGGVCHDQLQTLLPQALHAVRQQADYTGFDRFIEILLQHYYDPMYDYQMRQTQRKTVFTGNAQEVSEWLLAQDGKQPQ